MPTDTETPAQAWKRRAALAGTVDFTMMYVAHDAFNRDLERLVRAAESGQALTPAAYRTWTAFCHQLHTHHRAEDTALWPRLRAAVSDPAELQVLADMEAEHATIDPRIEQIDAAVADHNETAVAAELAMLATGLSQHMIHEEEAALPLLERRLGAAGWEAFTQEIRQQQGGLKGAAEYLPWVLDGATPESRTAVLALLPAPARLLYRRVWEPGYRRSGRLGQP